MAGVWGNWRRVYYILGKFFRRSQRRVPVGMITQIEQGNWHPGMIYYYYFGSDFGASQTFIINPRPPTQRPVYSRCPGVHNIHPNHYPGVRLRALAFVMFVVILQALLSICEEDIRTNEKDMFLPILQCFGNWVRIRSFVHSCITLYPHFSNPWTTKAVLWHWKLRGLSWRMIIKNTKFGRVDYRKYFSSNLSPRQVNRWIIN